MTTTDGTVAFRDDVARYVLTTAFDDIRTTKVVHEEDLTEGKRGTAALDEFLEDVAVHGTPDAADEVASMEGVAETDASVILLAGANEEILLGEPYEGGATA